MDNAYLVIEQLATSPTERGRGVLEIKVDDLAIWPGQTLVIAGHNGSGKTTILEALFGFRREYQVSARFFDKPFVEAQASERRRLGVCFQRQTFNDVVKVADIMTLHNSVFGRKCANPALDFLALDELAAKRYGNLSGGEQQRVNLYFALAHEPPLFVADEPEKGLDESTLNALRKHLDDRARNGSSNLIASHNSRLFEVADRFLLLNSGRIEFDGAVDDAIEYFLGDTSWEMKINGDDFDAAVATIERQAPRAIMRKISDDRVRAYRLESETIDDLISMEIVCSTDRRKNKASDLAVVTERGEK